MTKKLEDLVHQVAQELDADLILYEGGIDASGYRQISDICESKSRTNAILFISTFGGSADAGFRIARALQHTYGGFRAVIAGTCKSAGTLVCIGAAGLVMADRSELGPLDVQVQKKDELFDYGSGLDLFEALSNLRQEALGAFRTYLIDLRTGGRLGTKPASEIASELVTGLFAPIYGQIDPIRLGEMQRAMAIAIAYGERLNETSRNLKPNALAELVSGYPSHGFVIDRKEARRLFKNVERPVGDLATLCDILLKAEMGRSSERVCVTHLNRELSKEKVDGGVIEATTTAADSGTSNATGTPQVE